MSGERKPYRRSRHHGRHAVKAMRHFFACAAGVFLAGSALCAVTGLLPSHVGERNLFWEMAFYFLAASLASLLIYALFKAARDWRHAKAHARRGGGVRGDAADE